MAESKPVSATTVEHLGAMARFFSCTWHFITTFSRPKDTLLDVWMWKMLHKIVLHLPGYVWLNFPPILSLYNSWCILWTDRYVPRSGSTVTVTICCKFVRCYSYKSLYLFVFKVYLTSRSLFLPVQGVWPLCYCVTSESCKYQLQNSRPNEVTWY